MFRTLAIAAGFSAVGYVAYPLVAPRAKASEPQKPTFFVHQNVDINDVAGSWVLTPRSTQLLSHANLPLGTRAHITLESWGGGSVFIPVGEDSISGPISWQFQPGTEVEAPSLKIRARAGLNYELKFSQVGASMALITAAEEFREGAQHHVRFLKLRDV